MHVKKFQQEHGCSYKDALKGAKATYKKGRGLEDIIKNAREKKPLFGGEIADGRYFKIKPDQRDVSMYAVPLGRGGSLSSMNKAYWKANQDLFNYTHKPMIAAATKLYGF
jgi:hypothetical protein